MDPHSFADPDPGSQNLADPTDPDPDPKHCFKANNFYSSLKINLFIEMGLYVHSQYSVQLLCFMFIGLFKS